MINSRRSALIFGILAGLVIGPISFVVLGFVVIGSAHRPTFWPFMFPLWLLALGWATVAAATARPYRRLSLAIVAATTCAVWVAILAAAAIRR